MPEHLILIRSAATDYDVQGRIRGTLDIPLCAAGIAEAERIGAGLAGRGINAVHAAASACAVETGRIVAAACGLPLQRIARLRNLDQGLWQGMLIEDIRRKQPRLHRQWQDNPWSVAAPEGELVEEACERVAAALEKLVRRHPSGRVALIVPTPLDRIVAWLVAGAPLGDLWGIDPDRHNPVEIPIAAQWRAATRRRRAQAL